MSLLNADKEVTSHVGKGFKIAVGIILAVLLAAGLGLWQSSTQKPVVVTPPAMAAVPSPAPVAVQPAKNEVGKKIGHVTKRGKKHREKKLQGG